MAAKACLVAITSFDPARKIQAIMRIREVTGVGIAEAKSILENAPSILMNGMYPAQAEQLSNLLEDIGMVVEIKADESNEPSLKNLNQLSFAPDPNKSTVVHKFVHEFEDDPEHGDFQVGLDAPPGVRIRFDLDGKNIWVSANRSGWLHLARICAEMGLHSTIRPGHHFHRSYDWADSPKSGEEVSFELVDDKEPI